MVLTCHAAGQGVSLRWTKAAGAREARCGRQGRDTWRRGDARMVASPGATVQDDPVALAEIELTAELIIAASTAAEERLSFARIDEVLEVDRSPAPCGR